MKKSIEIDLNNNQLIIKDQLSLLQSHQKSQLCFWDFIDNSQNKTYIYNNNDIETTLIKILEYFKGENIQVIRTESISKLINDISTNKQLFMQKVEHAIDFKNGKYNKSDYKCFSTFMQHNIKRKLKDHQLKSAYHLDLLGSSAIFSVPGSGKTSVVLAEYEYLKKNNCVNLLFVVGPVACFGPWKTEFFKTLGRQPDYQLLAGGKSSDRKLKYFRTFTPKDELYLTTYQTLLNDQSEIIKFFSRNEILPFLVVDEAHYMKRVNGNWANAVLQIAEIVKYKCILTGTPFPNSYLDIFNLFDFLYLKNNPINQGIKENISFLITKNRDEQIKSILDETIGPLFYRVRKSELNLLPPEFHKPIKITMNKYERIIYDAIVKKIRHYAKKDYLTNIELVQKLRRGRMMRLRQCISYTKLLKSAIIDYKENLIVNDKELQSIITNYDRLEEPSKITFLKHLIENLVKNQGKVVVWSNFIGTLKLIKHNMNKLKIDSEIIYGDTPIEKTTSKQENTREEIINNFVNGNLNILIANPAACAESISLHKTCFNAIYYDLSYNLAQYLQSLDRIHRVGGSETNIANYYFLEYTDTIDNDIKNSLERKAARMNNIIEEDYSIYSLDMCETDDDEKAYNRMFKG